MSEKTKERIELAILANGGDVHLKEWCTCDPEVNFFCQYCAIFNGLNEARILLSSLEKAQGELSELKDAIQRAQENNPDEQHCTCVPLLKVKIKELEATLASIKADPSIGKLVVECDCDHDGEFDAGQRHCRKCGEYLF